MSVSICHICVGTSRSQKRVLDPLELELQAVMSGLIRVLITNLEEQQVLLTAEPRLQCLHLDLSGDTVFHTSFHTWDTQENKVNKAPCFATFIQTFLR